MENKIIIVILSLLVLTQLVSAISIDIDMEESFGLGDEISFTYTIFSDITQDIEYIAVVNCPNSPLSLLEIKNTTLEASTPFVESYIYISSVSDYIEPQTCNVSVGILDPEVVEMKSFNIIVNPSFDFNVLTCKDLDCYRTTKVFVKDEDIYLDYSSEVSGVSVEAVLTYPDKSKKQLILPISIKANQIGTYNLEVVATSLENKDSIKKMQFGVIENKVSIPYSEVRGSEADDEEVEKSSSLFGYAYLLILFILMFGLIIFIRFFIKFKSKKKHKKYISKK